MLRLFLGSSLFVLATSGYSCPAYDDIRQSSVDPALFNISDFTGVWYLIATNEPTIPPFCTCGVNTVEVHESSGWYAYSNVDTCGGKANISVPIKGELSEDPQSPGFLRENFGPHNHTARTLDPNMIFEVSYGDSILNNPHSSPQELQLALTYACITAGLFSFNVLSRTNRWSQEDVENIVASANASTNGLLKVDGMRIADEAAYSQCGML
jgi:hypothetical protein